MKTTPLAILLAVATFLPPVLAVGLMPACDNNIDDAVEILTIEVNHLQAENDALRAAARLSAVAPPDASQSDDVAFREQGPPWTKYIPAAEKQSTISEIMAACPAKNITISTSGYDPDITTSAGQVMGVHYSYVGGAAQRKCLDDEMAKRKAVSL